MLQNSQKHNPKFQSYYTRVNDNYRSRHKCRCGCGETGAHRVYSSCFWEKTIPLILDYLKSHDLKPHHKLLDLGAGGLRSALALVPYLNSKNFYAIDINRYLLEDGYNFEIKANGLQEKFPINHIKVTHDYNGEEFNTKFDYVWSFSLWTHLDISECDKCLYELSKILKVGGVYLTTCFVVNNSEYYGTQTRKSDLIISTHHNKDPYHHKLEDFIEIGTKNGFEVEYCGLGSCCPRKHDVIKFIKK